MFKILKNKYYIPLKLVTDLDFKDNIAIIIEDVNRVHILLNKLEEGAGKVGLNSNAKKTEF